MALDAAVSALPNDVLRLIYNEALKLRHIETMNQTVITVMNAFDLACSGQTDGDYFTPMFEGSSDVAYVSLVYDGAFAKSGMHRYSLDIAVGDELFCLYRDEYESVGLLGDVVETDVKLHIENKNSSKKYESIVVESFRAMFPEDSIVY